VFVLVVVICEKIRLFIFIWLCLTPYLTQALFSPFGRDAAGREGYIIEINN
jgi:hypothetical protein